MPGETFHYTLSNSRAPHNAPHTSSHTPLRTHHDHDGSGGHARRQGGVRPDGARQREREKGERSPSRRRLRSRSFTSLSLLALPRRSATSLCPNSTLCCIGALCGGGGSWIGRQRGAQIGRGASGRAADRLSSLRLWHARRPLTRSRSSSLSLLLTPYSSPEMLFRFYAAESTLTHAEEEGAAGGGFTAAGQKVKKEKGCGAGDGERWRSRAARWQRAGGPECAWRGSRGQGCLPRAQEGGGRQKEMGPPPGIGAPVEPGPPSSTHARPSTH